MSTKEGCTLGVVSSVLSARHAVHAFALTGWCLVILLISPPN
jgi:hypothetical protein